MSLFPDIRPDRSVGPLVGSVITGTNADVIAAIAPLYLSGSVLDVTYGRGGWWRKYRPSELGAHDIKTDGVDFRALPEEDGAVDAVCFDPPYIPAGGHSDVAFRERYGLTDRTSQATQDALIEQGFGEAVRVSREWILFKCCDYVNARTFRSGSAWAIGMAERHDVVLWDVIVHAGGAGPGGGNIQTPIRARRAHSYLLVFRRRDAARRAMSATARAARRL